MRPSCPLCGEPCEDDGDRYYTDICFECGWRSAGRAQADRANDEKFREGLGKRAAKARAEAQDAFWAVIRQVR
jgi:predicted  nucleic acid-binding Zn-ribbon protein